MPNHTHAVFELEHQDHKLSPALLEELEYLEERMSATSEPKLRKFRDQAEKMPSSGVRRPKALRT